MTCLSGRLYPEHFNEGKMASPLPPLTIQYTNQEYVGFVGCLTQESQIQCLILVMIINQVLAESGCGNLSYKEPVGPEPLTLLFLGGT